MIMNYNKQSIYNSISTAQQSPRIEFGPQLGR